MMAGLTKPVEPLKITDPILNIDGLHLCYGNKEALRNISLATQETGHGVYRPFRVRQINPAALL